MRCLDPFHVVAWATQAVDEIHREVWNAACRGGQRGRARLLKGARWALWKNAEALSERQQRKLAWVQRVNQPLYRAYLLKEHLVRHEAHANRVDWNVHCRLGQYRAVKLGAA